MNSYTPPPGRPRSTPPALPSSSETPATPAKGVYQHVTAADVAAWSADFTAGMPLREIAAKHGRPQSTIGYALRKNGFSKPLPAAEEPPPARPAPTERPVRQDGESSQGYASRVQKWMMQADPAYRSRVLLNRSAAQRARALRMKRQKEREARRAEVAVIPPRPTFWQRIIGWFR
jgi:hypothetical protein